MRFPKDPKPERSPKYLEFIRSMPCAVCGTQRGVEAAHTGPHALGRKASDFSAIPLCGPCHRTGRVSYHRLGPAEFELVTGLHCAVFAGLLWVEFQGKMRKRHE